MCTHKTSPSSLHVLQPFFQPNFGQQILPQFFLHLFPKRMFEDKAAKFIPWPRAFLSPTGLIFSWSINELDESLSVLLDVN